MLTITRRDIDSRSLALGDPQARLADQIIVETNGAGDAKAA
jgi:hypothetical protein